MREQLLTLRGRLDELLVRRERDSQAFSFAQALQHDDADKMAEYARREVAHDAEVTDLRREIRSVDYELERVKYARGLRARVHRVVRSKASLR